MYKQVALPLFEIIFVFWNENDSHLKSVINCYYYFKSFVIVKFMFYFIYLINWLTLSWSNKVFTWFPFLVICFCIIQFLFSNYRHPNYIKCKAYTRNISDWTGYLHFIYSIKICISDEWKVNNYSIQLVAIFDSQMYVMWHYSN